MTIGEEVRYGRVEAEQWAALGASIGIAAGFLRRLREELAHAIPAAARELLDDPSFTTEERGFLEGVVALIERHAGYLHESTR